MTEAAASASRGYQNRKNVIMDHLCPPVAFFRFVTDTFSQPFSVKCHLPIIEVAESVGEKDTLFILTKVQFWISNQDPKLCMFLDCGRELENTQDEHANKNLLGVK